MQTLLKSHTHKVKGVFALMAMVICGTLLWQQIAAVPREDIMQTYFNIAPSQWLLAIAATCVSFWAIGQYDVVWHARVRTGTPISTAHRTGMAAIAIGQTIGAGAVTGALVRWQLMPDLGLKKTTEISIGVSLSFLACWAVIAVVAGIAFALLPTLALVLIVAIGLSALSILQRQFDMPPAQALKLLGLTALDISFAGFALWALIPDATLSMLIPVLAAYAIALGAGLISNAPGGLGAFDLCLMTLLGALPEASLLAGILAFRIVYYLGPALLAAIPLISAYVNPRGETTCTADPISDLCHQGALMTFLGTTAWTTRRHMLGKVALEPAGCKPTLNHFVKGAIGFRGLYKADKRLAALARAQGWSVRRIADDAVIDLVGWDISGPKMRQLRRKLSQATKAGVAVTQAKDVLPHDKMNAIAKQWAQSHGGELGYSMGRYCPHYIAQQTIYLIWNRVEICGFITVQTRPTNWAIDLIRHCDAMPTGAMHAAFAKVIADAQEAGVEALSLGAVPTGATPCRFQKRARAQKAGLIQFKQGFKPKWKPLYHAAPSPLQWVVSMAHVLWHVQRPLPRLLVRWANTLTSLINMSTIFHLKTG